MKCPKCGANERPVRECSKCGGKMCNNCFVQLASNACPFCGEFATLVPCRE